MTAIEKVIALAKSEIGYIEKASNRDLDDPKLAGVLSVLTSLAGLPEEKM